MKYILRFASIMCMTAVNSSSLSAAQVGDVGVVYRFTEYENKDSVVKAIKMFDNGVSLFLLEGLSKKNEAFQKVPKILPYHSFFGLMAVVAREMKISKLTLDPKLEKADLFFMYNSDISRNPSATAPEYDRRGPRTKMKGYAPVEIFLPEEPRIVFATRVKNPDISRMSSSQRFSSESATGRSYSYEEMFTKKHIDKGAFLSNFSNCVYKICDGGVFIAQQFVDYQREKHGKNAKVIGEIISLSQRELSEIVFWLWSRDGKAATYPELCRRHPELFEPIRGFNEFKSEIGQMLLAHGKK